MTDAPKRLVILHAAQDRGHAADLLIQLRALKHAHSVEIWTPLELSPGDDTGERTDRQVASASLLIVLVSADYFPGVDDGLGRHIASARERAIRLVPVQVRPCLWEESSLAELELLPRGGEPVSRSTHPEHTWVEIAREIKSLLGLPAKPADSPSPGTALPTAEAADRASSETLEAPAPPVIPPEVREAADSEDASVRRAAYQRIAEISEALTPDDVAFLAERLDALPREALLSIVWRHGTLGATERIVARLAVEMPDGRREQLRYLSLIGVMTLGLARELPEVLGEDAFAKLVAAVQPKADRSILSEMLRRVRGGDLFNAVNAAGGSISTTIDGEPMVPLTALLLEACRDDEACRRILRDDVGSADTPRLVRIESILRHAQCSDLAAYAGRRLRDRFGVVLWRNEKGKDDIYPYHWRFVIEWAMAEGEDRPVRIRWLADRLWELEQRDMPYYPGTDLDELRVELARDLADRGKAVGWAGDVVKERLSTGTVEAWRLAFAWWRPWNETQLQKHRDIRKWMLTEAPVPAEVPDDFDERFLSCVRDEMEYEAIQTQSTRDDLERTVPQIPWAALPIEEMAGFRYAHHIAKLRFGDPFERLRPVLTMSRAIPRLLGAALTPSRATWIARLAKEAPAIFEHDRIGDLGRLAEPMSPADLPPLKKLDLNDEKQVRAYRALTGEAGDALLRAHFRAVVSSNSSPPDAIESLCDAWPWIGSVADDALRAEMRDRIRGAALFVLATIHRDAPWLVDKPMLHEEARRQLDVDYWQEVRSLPPSLFALVLERARRTRHEHELLELLDWLDRHGIPAAERVNLLMCTLPIGASFWASKITPMVAAEADWNRWGPKILQPLVAEGRWFLVHSFLNHLVSAFSQTHLRMGEPEQREATQREFAALLAAVHRTFAEAILGAVESAAPGSDEASILGLLDALLRLSPGPGTLETLSTLSRRSDLSEAAKSRIEHAKKLFEKAPAAASHEALLDAVEAAFAPHAEVWKGLLPGRRPADEDPEDN